MLKRLFLILVTLGCIAWIGFVGFDLINLSEKSKIDNLFTTADRQVYIIHDLENTSVDELKLSTIAPLEEIIERLKSNSTNQERIYFSAENQHIVYEASSNPNFTKLKLLFGDSLNRIGYSEFEWKGFNIRTYKNLIDFRSAITIVGAPISAWPKLDKNASYSVLSLDQSPVLAKDVYFDINGKNEFTSVAQNIYSKITVSDQPVFSAFIPSEVKAYHFWERNYLAESDSIYREGPAYLWGNSGLVLFEFMNEEVLLSDYLPSREPIDVLRERNIVANENESYTSLRLFSQFSPKTCYTKVIEDFIYVSKSKEVLETIEGRIKIGQTLALNKNKLLLQFENTPQYVSERKWNDSTNVTRTGYKNNLFSLVKTDTKAGTLNNEGNLDQQFSEKKIISVGAKILDIASHPTKDILAVLTANNKLILLSGNEEKRIDLSSLPNADLQWILGTANQEYQLFFSDAKSLHAYSQTGIALNGFPIIAQGIIPGAFAISQKAKSIVFSTSTGHQFHDLTGKFQKSIKAELNSLSFRSWIYKSGQSEFYACLSSSKFEMIDLEKKELFRSIDVQNIDKSVTILPNQLMMYQIENDILSQINQKGTRHELRKFKNSKLITNHSRNITDRLFIQENNTVHVFDINGLDKIKIELEFNEVNWIENCVYSSKLYYAILDGIENKIYLYTNSGERLNFLSMEGHQEICLTPTKSGIFIYSTIDNFVVKYCVLN